jgi:hypothetical protein
MKNWELVATIRIITRIEYLVGRWIWMRSKGYELSIYSWMIYCRQFDDHPSFLCSTKQCSKNDNNELNNDAVYQWFIVVNGISVTVKNSKRKITQIRLSIWNKLSQVIWSLLAERQFYTTKDRWTNFFLLLLFTFTRISKIGSLSVSDLHPYDARKIIEHAWESCCVNN